MIIFNRFAWSLFVLGSNQGGEYRIQILVGGYIKVEDEGEDLTDKKVGCGGMRRGIWLGGWHTINQGWPAYQVF